MTDINDWPGRPDADPDCECCLGDGLQADGETPCPCIDARKANFVAQTIPSAPQPAGEAVLREIIDWCHLQPGNYPNWMDRARQAVGDFEGDPGQPPQPSVSVSCPAQASPDQYRREGFQAGIAAAAQVLLDACPNPIFDQLKPALMGEVTEHVVYTDEDGNEVYYDRPVSWDAMKEIIRAALRALKGDA